MVDNPPAGTTLGAILAGGAATRMGELARGGDKCLTEIGGAPLLAHVARRLRPQVAALLLNANGDPARFASFDLPVIGDDEPGEGPLGGVIAALGETQRRGFAFCLTVPGDAPLLPRDLAARLHGAIADAPCAVAFSAGERQSVFALWPTSALGDLRRLYDGRTRALWRAQQALGAAEVAFADAAAFQGLNRPEDRAALAMALAKAKD